MKKGAFLTKGCPVFLWDKKLWRLSSSLQWWNNKKEICLTHKRTISDNRGHPNTDCKSHIFTLNLGETKQGEVRRPFPTQSYHFWKLQFCQSAYILLKLVNSCKKEWSLDYSKHFLAVLLWLANRWVYNRIAGYGNMEKSIKFNFYIFPNPGHMSEGFLKKSSEEFIALYNHIYNSNIKAFKCMKKW